VSLFSLIVFLGCALSASDVGTLSTTPSLSSTFLPPIGQTAHYRYSDMVTTPKETKREAAMVAIESVAENQVHVTIEVEGQEPRNLDLSVDAAGALQPPADAQRDNDLSEQTLSRQALLVRLSLAARIGTNPRAATSFPVLLNIPWASGPVNPMVSFLPAEPDGFVGNAIAATSVNPPKQQQRLNVLLAPGIGLTGALIGGTAGRLIALGGLARSAVIANHSVPRPVRTDIKLHITGQLADGRLQVLYGDQENSMHARGHDQTFSDKWSLIADGLI
jgi:hypothetical protein